MRRLAHIARKRSADTRVGTVLSVSGSNTCVKRSAGGKLVALRKGTDVYLHDIIAAGPGTHAKLTLSVRKGSIAWEAGDT